MKIWLHVGILIASTLLIGSTANAQSEVPVGAPEIDAFSGLAAMGVIGSIAALIWERRRK